MENDNGDIYTIWKDGSHLERWTNDTIVYRNPTVSHDGSKLAVSVKQDKGFDIFILPVEDF
jgi:Tol biopolymer transport system component